MAIATLAEYKAFVGIAPGDTTNDVKIQMFIDSVSQQIKNFCECSFEPVVVTRELHDGVQSDIIAPRETPIISIQQVVFGCDALGDNGTPLATTDFYKTESVIKLTYRYTPRGRGRVRLDYTHGYAAVPADVKMALLQSVKAEMDRDSKNTEGIGSIRKQDEAINYNSGWDTKTGLPSQIVSKLQPYRSYGFPVGAGNAQRNW